MAVELSETNKSKWVIYFGEGYTTEVGIKIFSVGHKSGTLYARMPAGTEKEPQYHEVKLQYSALGAGYGLGLSPPVTGGYEWGDGTGSPVHFLCGGELRADEFQGQCLLSICGVDAGAGVTGSSWLYIDWPDRQKAFARWTVRKMMAKKQGKQDNDSFDQADFARAVCALNSTSFSISVGASAGEYAGKLSVVETRICKGKMP